MVNMLKLIRFDLRNIFVRKSTYLIPLIEIIFLVIITLTFSNYKYGYVLSNNFFIYLLLFFFSIIFIVFQVIFIFKKAENNGMDIFLLSKPISKLSRVVAQIATNISGILFYILFLFFVSLFGGLINPHTNNWQMFMFAGSIALANFIIMSIFSSLIIFGSQWMSTHSIIFTWTIFACFIPIVSSVIQSSSLNTPFDEANEFAYSVTNKNVEDTKSNYVPKIQSTNSIYFDQINKKKPDSTQLQSWNAYKNSIYDKLAWIDPWYQLSNLYKSDVASNDNLYNRKWIVKKSTFNFSNDNLIIKLNGTEYALIVSDHVFNNRSNKNNQMLEAISKNAQLLDEIRGYKTELDTFTFEKQMVFANQVFQNVLSPKDIIDSIKKENTKYIEYQFMNDTTPYSLATLFLFQNSKILTISQKSNMDIDDLFANKMGNQVLLIKKGQTFYQFIPENFIKKQWILLIWFTIFSISITIPIFIYIRRKIKLS